MRARAGSPATPAHEAASGRDWTTCAACAELPHLPWTRDEVDIPAWDALTMSVVCDNCPVRTSCEAAVIAWDITGGWWAGRDRDPEAAVPLLSLIHI